MANRIWDVEALGPSDQSSGVDSKLAHGEAEGKAEIKQVFFGVSIALPADVGLEVLVVMDAQECLDLPGEEEEEVFGGTGGHKFPWDHDLRLGEGKRGIAM